MEEPLSTFFDLVGGHSLILKLGDAKLLKSSNPKEIGFYEEFSENEKISQIIPRYYGTVEVNDSINRSVGKVGKAVKLWSEERGIKSIEDDSQIEQWKQDFEEFVAGFKFDETEMKEIYAIKDCLEGIKSEEKTNWFCYWFIKWNKRFFEGSLYISRFCCD